VVGPMQGLYLNTGNTTQRKADTHPYPEQDSKLRSQHPSDRGQYLPQALGYWDRHLSTWEA